MLFLFAALRFEFGNDYISYYNNYIGVKNGTFRYGSQILFELLNKFSPNFYVLIALTSAFSIAVLYKLIKDNVSVAYCGIALAILLINPYLFLMSLSAIRQTIGMCLLILGTYFSYRRKPVTYFVLILIATLFHTSAILLLPVYFIANERKVGKLTCGVYLLAVLALLFFGDLFNSIVELVLEQLNEPNYWYYYNQDVGNSLRATLLSGIYFLYILINIPYLEGKTLMYAKLYLLGLTCALFAYKVSMATRVQQYFDIFSVVAIPMIMETNRKRCASNTIMNVINRFVFPALIFVIYILRYYSFFTNPLWESFTTYQTIFGVLL